ncbi:hypothetical protein MLD38_036776 [Melastoma candidum]|uniref:Uncharacterized protein n=1 Tax=Melastoma candidum TaxID=119954 RepID=A0ACB9LK17_9MYRT|nr:hypothetical protein MLD38_036776 [Melastoma candidum]
MNFPSLRTLRVVFPSGELCLGDNSSTLHWWRAHFGSSLKRCLILAAAATSSSSSPRTSTFEDINDATRLICRSLQ